ncbi:Subtilisin-like protease [Morella rubra]|uniref:Subtilisin-like protease n=1 Tax=Morella rubra TaxID=262757 RepID=A0A6A1WB84_9ROSI|nr:Subtilisin-like protease [Morella rubra]
MGSVNRVHPCLLFLTWFCVPLIGGSNSAKRFTYIVHMDKFLMPKVFSSHQNWYASTIDSLKFTSISSVNGHRSAPSAIYMYDTAIHGFCVVLSPDELEALKKFPGFISAYRDGNVMLDTTRSPEFLSLNPVTGLLHASNHGKDIIIGIIDTGIWPESPSFKDSGIATKVPSKWTGSCEGGQDFNSSMCNAKLIGARYFNEAIKGDLKGQMLSMDSARDTSGHGTMVSAIAAGNYVEKVSFSGYAEGTAKGVAPYSRVAAYKVSWNEGTRASDVLAGIDQAVADGCDVICISLGFSRRIIYEDPIAIASFAAMEKGIVVSTVAGNSGPGFKSTKNGFPWVLTATASTIDRQIGGTLILGNVLNIHGWSMFTGKAAFQNMPLWYDQTLSTCDSSALLSKAPYGIIICSIGDIDKQIKSIVTINLTAVVLVTRDPTILDLLSVSYPYMVITPESAQVMMTYVENSYTPFASMEFRRTFTGIKPAPTVASYASRGPSRYFPNVLKPDVMAPGTLILTASVPNGRAPEIGADRFANSNYMISSGTSLACPHAAGVAALLKSVHPEWSATAIKSAIMTTANSLDNTLHPILEYKDTLFQIASPLAVGAGHIDPNKAIDPGLIYDMTPQDYVNHLCSFRSYKPHIKEITRTSNYSCLNPSSDLNYPAIMSFFTFRTFMEPKKFQRTVTNVGGGATTYNAIVTEPSGYEVTMVPKTLIFKRKYEKQTYSVTITSKGVLDLVSFGQIIWVEENREHLVRSPIVVYHRELK